MDARIDALEWGKYDCDRSRPQRRPFRGRRERLVPQSSPLARAGVVYLLLAHIRGFRYNSERVGCGCGLRLHSSGLHQRPIPHIADLAGHWPLKPLLNFSVTPGPGKSDDCGVRSLSHGVLNRRLSPDLTIASGAPMRCLPLPILDGPDINQS